MITTQSQHPDIKPKKARLLSDWAILNGFFNSPIWKLLFTRFSQAIDKLFIQFMQANNALLAYGWTSVARMKHGSMAGGGIIQMLLVCFFVLALNSKLVTWKIFSLLAAWFVVPLMPFFKSPKQLHDLIFVQIESQALLIYGGVFLLTSLVHVFKTWIGFANKSVTSRGVGYSYLLIDRFIGGRVHVNPFAIYMLESLLVTGVGVFLWVKQIDPYFGGWLVGISLAEIRILVFEKTGQIQARRLLDV